MNTSPHWYSRVCLAGLLAVLGCSDSSSPTSDSQSVDFRYAGGLTGHFRAVGPATAVGDPTRSFAVAFRSAAGETQLCAYQPGWRGFVGNFFLLNIGVINAPGRYSVPPPWAPNATSYQPGTFLLGVDPSHTYVQKDSRFIEGEVEVQELSAGHVRGGFAIEGTNLTTMEGRFDVLVARLEELPIICQ
jgi:hypothetical protein